jgi:hypothetical protein
MPSPVDRLTDFLGDKTASLDAVTGRIIFETTPAPGVTTGGALVSGAITNVSGTCSGADQTIQGATTNRKYFLFQNPAINANSMWIDFGVAAVAASPAVEIQPGGSFIMDVFVSTDAIHIIGTNTQKWTAKAG